MTSEKSSFPSDVSSKNILKEISSLQGNSSEKKESPFLPFKRKKKFKVYDPIVWILYEDLEKSATSLTNFYLSKTIVNIIRLIVCSHYYFSGIRSNRIFKVRFSKENHDETMALIFPNLETTYQFKFVLFKHKVGKWARQCWEHMDFLEKYLAVCLKEWNFRVPSSPHQMTDMAMYFLLENNVKRFLPKANLKKITPVWQMIPPKYRSKDVYLSYRKYYAHLIDNPFEEYALSGRDIPEFVLEKHAPIV